MKLAHRLCVVVFALAGVALSLPSVRAQAPAVSSLSPLSLRPGQTQDIVVRGGNLAGATHFWTGFPSQAVLTPQKANNGKNPAEVSFRLTVPPETAPGIYGMRIATNHGISPLRILLVDDLPVVLQQPGNTNPTAAQLVSVPTAIDGTAEPLASHFYKFHVEAGQRLSLEIFARRIGSALDPTLRLFNASGRELAYSDDLPGLSEDAEINYTFAKAGNYVIAVEDNLYQGGGNYPYHLRIGDFPGAVVALPLGATRGREVTFRFADKAGAEIEPVHVKIPANPLLFAMNVPARFVGGATRSFATVLLSDHGEFSNNFITDHSPLATHGSTELAKVHSPLTSRVEFGANLNGRLEKPGDVDRFIFRAKAGQSVRFTAFARRLGSPADVVLRLTKADGSQLSYAEGAAANEATLSSSFPADGDYVLEVADLNHRGGPRYAYLVEATPSDAGFSLTTSADTLNIPAGGTAIVTVTALRARYIGPITVQAVGLPAGVTSIPTVIGPGHDSVVLSLRSTAGVTAGRVHPIRIVGSARIRNADFQASATVTSELKTALSGMPYPPVALSSATALGIGPPPAFTLRTEPATLVFGRNLSATVKVVAERQKGFDEEIALAVVPAEADPKKVATQKHPLPAGITAGLKPIPKGASSVAITFVADNKAALAEFTTVVAGSLKKGNQTLTEPAPGIALKLEEPFQLSVVAESGKLPRKGKLKLKVTARRNPAFSGEIALACSQLPKGVIAAPVKLAVGATEQEIILSATPDAAPGAIKNAKVQGQAKVGGGRFSSKVPLPGIAVE